MTLTSHSPLHVLDAQSLVIGGVEPITPHRWYGRLATGVLLAGDGPGVPWTHVKAGLRERRGLVDAVVFGGDEPTRQSALADAMAQARELGYLVGLLTRGGLPRSLADVLSLADWVGIEVGAAGAHDVSVWTSLELIMRSGLEYEVTISVDPSRHTREDVRATAREVIRRGAHAPVLCGRRLYDVIHPEDLPDLERR
ncbi:hypothetical protein [Demequina sp.]|uniref:hypothetical protein n=1 Tax=Demequina sp. TaxID=2050685 RepID=UPI003D0AA945